MPDQPPRPAGDPGEELVELVDTAGVVTRIVTRRQMRRTPGARHRCTYVVVRRSDGRIVVHQRAAWKDVSPLAWDLAFGGICGVGEAWRSSAMRELAEEAGLTDVDLVDLGQAEWTDGHAALVGRVFLATTDAPLAPVDGEVVAVDAVAMGDLDAWMRDRQMVDDTPAIVLPLLRAHLG